MKNKSLESEKNFIKDDVHPKRIRPIALNRREASIDQLKHEHHLGLIPKISQSLRGQHEPTLVRFVDEALFELWGGEEGKVVEEDAEKDNA